MISCLQISNGLPNKRIERTVPELDSLFSNSTICCAQSCGTCGGPGCMHQGPSLRNERGYLKTPQRGYFGFAPHRVTSNYCNRKPRWLQGNFWSLNTMRMLKNHENHFKPLETTLKPQEVPKKRYCTVL